MYILFEKKDYRDDSDLTSAYHKMGYTNDESSAEDWVSENPEYRYYCYLLCVWRAKSEDTWSSATPLEIERKRWEEAIAEICRIKEKYGYDTDIPHFISGYDFLHDAEKRKRWDDITTDFKSFLT